MTTNQPAPPGRTFTHDDRLPRVPLPTLDDSCDRLIQWCAPLLTPSQLASTEEALAAFRAADGPGPVLQRALEEYDAAPGTHSWLDTFWPYRYLGRRDRIALNANFFFLFNDPPAPTGQIDRAAGLVAAAVAYKLRLDDESVAPAERRGEPLSMDQHRYLFSATRIPGETQDSVRVPYSAQWPGPSTARHIVVFHRGNAFRMEAIGPEGAPHSVTDLAAGLAAVAKAGSEPAAPGTAVGHLTTGARAQWARNRELLTGLHPANAAALDEIETALFCVSLDDAAPGAVHGACDQLLHGDSGNRWFDKALTFVVLADGRAGVNVEHCGLDGTTILSFTDDLMGASAEEHSHASGARDQGLPAVEPLAFVLDDHLRSEVIAAAEAFADYAAATATTTLTFDTFGSGRAKALRTSPDAFVQLAYQLAHQRAKGMIGATYESIATRQWRRGRTEAMRVVTPEVQRFVSTMEEPASPPGERLAAFRAAADAHVRRARECQQGDAPEQHLWEMQLIQRRRGAELGVTEEPALYRSPGWTVLRDDYLSTSSAPSVNIQFFGFGSTSERCIGVAYVLLPDRFHLYLSTPAPVAAQMDDFAGHLRDVVAELDALLAEAAEAAGAAEG
ncbi:choline/carnitine O-acyltransferase [Streptomyces sp. SM14]|uniref:choline/carnitine O-acyltransferase n=2 Tax=unclassified Streptomyces TaxID=2593676 RepID=UPI0015E164A7|nr:choline/carnitine O-acyltransferase [Streptomyces sp. SM14]